MNEYAVALVADPAASPTERLAQAVGDAVFAVANFAAKAAGGLTGGLLALATSPLIVAAARSAVPAVEAAGASSPDGPVADGLAHAAPEPDAPLAPVAQAVRELDS